MKSGKLHPGEKTEDPIKVGDLVEPSWCEGDMCDYFDVYPTGYLVWNRGDLGVVVSVEKKKNRRDNTVDVLHPSGTIIAFQSELRAVRKYTT